MLTIRPLRRHELDHASKGRTFDVSADGQSIGRVTDQGAITINDRSYTITGGGVTSPGARETLAILRDGHLPKLTWIPHVLANADGKAIATSQRAGSRAYTVSQGDQAFRFARSGWISSTWHLSPQEGGALLGSIAKVGWFGLTCRVELPETLDKVLQVFLFWQRLRWEIENSSQDTPYISTT